MCNSIGQQNSYVCVIRIKICMCMLRRWVVIVINSYKNNFYILTLSTITFKFMDFITFEKFIQKVQSLLNKFQNVRV